MGFHIANGADLKCSQCNVRLALRRDIYEICMYFTNKQRYALPYSRDESVRFAAGKT